MIFSGITCVISYLQYHTININLISTNEIVFYVIELFLIT